jgi:multidrug resistance efflux pump
LVELANADLESQLEQARAALSAAEAEVRDVVTGPSLQQTALLQAKVGVARSKRDKAYAVWQSAQREVDEQQDIRGQIVTAQTRLSLAILQVELPKAALDEARSSAQAAAFSSLDRQVLDFRARAAEWRVVSAQAEVAAAQATVDWLKDLSSNPLALRALANRAKGDYAAAHAACSVTEAELADAIDGATREDKSVAEARFQVALAKVRLVEFLVDRLKLRAPSAGTVLNVNVHGQETVVAGATLMTLADLTDLRLTVFVPQTQLGKVRIGQAVEAVVDSYPGSYFPGRVLAIADEAEYTPRNVATQDGRTNTVFAVQISLPNSDGRLKPGMAADVTLAE